VSDNGRYRIQSVAEMTGVSAATLRAWERRYGIPAPQRTASAYRLYTDHDVELVKRVRELCDSGIAPAQAAQMVLASKGGREEFAHLETDTHELAIQKILEGVERFDADRVEAAVKHALYLGPATTLFERVLGPALRRIGDRWHEGSISIGQEHLASEIVGNALRYLLRLAQPEGASKTAVLACFADEEHVNPLYGVGLRFTEWGFRTVMLGTRTPPHAIQHAVSEVHPDLVGLSLTIVPPAYRIRELLDGYAEACHKTPWLVGGPGAEKIRELVEARGGALAPDDRGKLQAVVERLTGLGEAT
jgi:MerR family transcriptional regulator, light-induced transcriptional regulator